MTEKQPLKIPFGMTEDEYWDWVTYTPKGAIYAGAKDHKAYGNECPGEDCIIHGMPLYEREDPYP